MQIQIFGVQSSINRCTLRRRQMAAIFPTQFVWNSFLLMQIVALYSVNIRGVVIGSNPRIQNIYYMLFIKTHWYEALELIIFVNWRWCYLGVGGRGGVGWGGLNTFCVMRGDGQLEYADTSYIICSRGLGTGSWADMDPYGFTNKTLKLI